METNHFITEESVTIKDFERVCRTCLSTIDLQPISEVFDLGYFPVEIALSKYTQVQFDPSDKLPQQICSNCVKNLNNSYSFLLNCDLVNTSLKECLARYESNLQTTCLPNEIEYVNCQIKEEPVEFEFSETNENAAVPPSTVNANLHTAVEIKEEAANNSVDENDSDNFDSDGDQIITNVPRSGGETDNSIPKKKTKPEMERHMNNSGEETCASLIPIKSRKTYDKSYDNFIKWCKKRKSKDITENIVLEYISGIYDKYRASSLWTQYSILKTTLIAHKNIDISKFNKVIELLKGKTDNSMLPKKSLLLNKEHVETFISEAPDGMFLMIKVALIIGISGACRREELCALTVDDIQDTGSALLLTVRNKTTKTTRKFTIQDNNRNQSYLAFIKKYAALRPAHTDHRRFFIYYKDGRCSTQVVGKNTFSKLPSVIATFLQLPDPKLYSGNCFKKYSSTLANTNVTTVKQHGGWIVHAL